MRNAVRRRGGMPFGGERIDARSDARVVFVWSAPSPEPGIPPPERYRLCLAVRASGCAAPGAVVYDAGASTRFETAIPAALAGKLLAWSVAACGPGYGTGASDDECSWAKPRALDARGF